MTLNAPDASRFQFGENWRRFLSVLDDERIREAERGLTTMLGEGALLGKSFLDVGSGSGLMSLAAIRLGASRVHSFDYDLSSVACTGELKRRYFPSTDAWTVEHGDILDRTYVDRLGEWDVVYSWGVLHHTGNLWMGVHNAAELVRLGGTLFVAVYNDQGIRSRYWRRVKHFFNLGRIQRGLVIGTHVPYLVARGLAADVLLRRNPLLRYLEYRTLRGMSVVHDWIDWLGGYPFEVATPDDVFDFLKVRGFSLERMVTTRGGWGCNQYVLVKTQRFPSVEIRGQI